MWSDRLGGAFTMTTDSMQESSADTTLESWVDLLVADDEWVRREFEDIVAAGWGSGTPRDPPTIRRSERPRRRGHESRLISDRPPDRTYVEAHAQACERSPPR
jgi:hypothetical protein